MTRGWAVTRAGARHLPHRLEHAADHLRELFLVDLRRGELLLLRRLLRLGSDVDARSRVARRGGLWARARLDAIRALTDFLSAVLRLRRRRRRPPPLLTVAPPLAAVTTALWFSCARVGLFPLARLGARDCNLLGRRRELGGDLSDHLRPLIAQRMRAAELTHRVLIGIRRCVPRLGALDNPPEVRVKRRWAAHPAVVDTRQKCRELHRHSDD